MAVLAVIMPVLMLGVVLALGRYEELVLPGRQGPDAIERRAGEPDPAGGQETLHTPAA